MEKLLTRKEVQEKLGVSERTLNEWQQQDELIPINVSRSPASKRPRWRYRHADVDQFLVDRQVKPKRKGDAPATQGHG